MIYCDQRWIGNHGIGRFARHVLATVEYHPILLSSHPAAPLDPWRLSRALGGLNQGDLFFSPGYNSPLFCAAPFVFTIHDLNHIDRPENGSTMKRLYYLLIMKRACHRSARVLTVSEFSRARIIEWSGVPAQKVVNVQCGVDPEYNPRVGRFNLPFPYLLCVSNRKAHKNEFRTVEGFAHAGLGADVRLVFTGNPTRELMACIQRNRISDLVHFAGLVPDGLLPSLYRSAEGLVFVSLYEGFGLPVLEAMACGTPVVTSNTTALQEIAGDSALVVNPTSVEEIANGIRRIMTDSDLSTRLRQRGLLQAARYSWNATTAKVNELFAGCLAQPAGKLA